MAKLNKQLLDKLESLVGYDVPVRKLIFNSRTETGGILIICFFDDDRIFRVEFMNKTAACIYYFCDGNRNVADIVGEMMNLFADGDRDRIFESTVACIRRFERKGIVSLRREF